MSGRIDRDSFVIHQSFLDGFATMNKTQICKSIEILAAYAMHGIEPEIDDPLVKMWFNMVKYTVDHDVDKYLKKAENGRKGGLAKASKLSKTSDAKQNVAKLAKASRLSVNDNVNVNVNDNVNVINKSTTKVVEAKPETFGNVEINNFIEEFEKTLGIPVNHSKKSERYAAKRLINRHKFDQCCKLLRIARAAQEDKYAPRIGSILDLDQKQGELVVWGRQQTTNSTVTANEVVVL